MTDAGAPNPVSEGVVRAKMALVLLFSGACWGLTVSLATFAMADGRAALGVTFWSTVFGALLLSLALWAQGRRPMFTRRAVIFYAVTGFVGTAFPHTLSNAAAAHLPAGVRSIVFALIPFMTLALAAAIARERFNWRRVLGLGLGFAGVAVLVAPDPIELTSSIGPQERFWLAISLLAVASYAVEGLYIAAHRPSALDATSALWGMHMAAIAMLAAAALATDASLAVFDGVGRPEAAILAMSALHLAAYGGLLLAIARAGPVFAAQVSYIVTPAGVLWGVWLLAEPISASILIALGLVLAGLALTTKS